jgi:Rap1a immunity proteins
VSVAVLLVAASSLAQTPRAERQYSGAELATYAALWEQSRPQGFIVGDNNVRNIEYFVGFVTGVAGASGGSAWCSRENVTWNQIWGVAAKYLREHPELWHMHPAHLVEQALVEAFPCVRGKPKSGP